MVAGIEAGPHQSTTPSKDYYLAQPHQKIWVLLIVDWDFEEVALCSILHKSQ